MAGDRPCFMLLAEERGEAPSVAQIRSILEKGSEDDKIEVLKTVITQVYALRWLVVGCARLLVVRGCGRRWGGGALALWSGCCLVGGVKPPVWLVCCGQID